MKHSRIRMFSCVFVIVVATLLLRTGAVEARSVLTCGGWNIVSDPVQGNRYLLNGVAASSANDVWAVGSGQVKKNRPNAALIQHWDGSSWSSVKVPTFQQDTVLYGVAVVSSKDVWAVGNSQKANTSQTLIEHWNGTHWKVISSPNAGSQAYLYGETAIASKDVWAVGFYRADSQSPAETLIEHWNGSSWSVMPSPNPGSSNGLVSVSANATNDVWAVGSIVDQNNNVQTLAEHWDGSQWSVVTAPQPSSYVNNLTGVTAISLNDIWAVGWYRPSQVSSNYTLTEHWDGTQWSIVASPSPGQNGTQLSAVTAISTSSVWAVGNEAGAGTFTLHWDGMQWSVVPSPNPQPNVGTLNAVAAVPGNQGVWSVGNYYLKGKILPLTEFYC